MNELAAFDTSCFPRATFVGHSEFVAFGCRGSDDKQDFAGFNLKGDEMWQQNFTDTHVSPTFSFAPAAGRFALGRTIVSSLIDADSPLPASLVTGQEVRVYQSYNGKQLFKIDLTPVERAGQNFALSADGMRLAVVRETLVHHAATKDYEAYTQREAGVEVYPLPAADERRPGGGEGGGGAGSGRHRGAGSTMRCGECLLRTRRQRVERRMRREGRRWRRTPAVPTVDAGAQGSTAGGESATASAAGPETATAAEGDAAACGSAEAADAVWAGREAGGEAAAVRVRCGRKKASRRR